MTQMRRHRLPVRRVASAVFVIAGFFQSFAHAQQNNGRTVWEGVYTAAQAEHGEAAYREKCGACHKNDLSGYESALKGDNFMRHWGEDSLDSLYRVTKSTMPRGAPGTLQDAVYVDILAYILQANGFPSGANELTVGALRNVRVEGKSGPAELPVGALVNVVGCLAQDPQNEWMLTRATKLIRTRDPKSYPAEELKTLAATPLGKHNFGLMDAAFYEPESKKDHKVAVKGLLIRSDSGVRINLTTLQSTGSKCEL